MRTGSVLLAVSAIIVVISLISIWFYPSIQDFAASNRMWNGLKNFMREFGATTIDSLASLPEAPEKTQLITIPYLDYTAQDLEQLRHFVEEGGNLMLMDDYGYGNRFLEYLGVTVRFSGKPLLDPLFCYRNQWMPRVTDFGPEVNNTEVKAVMLDHATSIMDAASVEAIAWSSSTSFLDLNDNGSWEEGEPKGPFPVAAEFRFGKGRVDLVSDPSIMINSVYGRDDNYQFMKYLISRHAGVEKTLIDNSHLTKAPLDVSKSRLSEVRQALSTPYAVLGILVLIFIAVSGYTLRKGETVG